MMSSKGEARPMLKHNVMVEQYRKDEKQYKLYTSFTPSFSAQSVTGKFYSKYEQIDATQCDPKYLAMIIDKSVSRPKDKYPQPVLDSHKYGWYTDPMIDLDKSDMRLHHPRNTTEISRIGVMLMMSMLKK